MPTYHFNEIVNDKGSVTISGLPPLTQVVVVIQPDRSDWQERMKNLMEEVSGYHTETTFSNLDNNKQQTTNNK